MAREAFFSRHQELPTGRCAWSLTLGYRLVPASDRLSAWFKKQDKNFCAEPPTSWAATSSRFA